VLADQRGRLILPSVVGVNEAGELLVGEEARNQYVLYPERTVRSIKRLMGGDDKVHLAGKEYTPQEISAIILKRLKEIAEQNLGRPIHKAVITVPAFFSDAQRQATREAGEIAGFEVARIINEPTAAALVYEAAQHQGKRILAYDLGGGTFDVSIVRIEEGVVEVISSHGNNHLGGDDFDHKIVEHILEHLKIKHGVDAAGNAQAMARILRSAENAKKHLSDHPFARIDEEYIAEADGKPVHLAMELSREEYEEMITPFIEETLGAIHTALESASLTSSHIDEILLVGGATRTPLIRARLFEVLGKEARGEVDPDLCVAMGAAIQGASVAGDEVSAVLVDVTPYTFGTSALGELNGELYPYKYVPIIAKNTPIPVRKSEAFYTVHDDQTVVDVHIYQGEEADALENIEIGEFRVEGLGKAPAGNTIILDLALDRDGILHVSAKEKATGLERRITIDKAMSRFDEDELDSARQRINQLFGEGEEVAPSDGTSASSNDAELDALLAKARAKLDTAGDEDRDEIVDLIETIGDCRENNDDAGLAEASRQLGDLLFYLET
jgi:molecular chaperone DnaK